jgi:hypothetical protein
MTEVTRIPDLNDLPQMNYKGQSVATTAMLAVYLGSEPKHIRQNFAYHKDKFQEGVHYHTLEGAELKEFKRYTLISGSAFAPAPSVTKVYIWTQKGAARHAKMLNTQPAWDLYEAMEDHYFNRSKALPPPAAPAPRPLTEEEVNKRFADAWGVPALPPQVALQAPETMVTIPLSELTGLHRDLITHLKADVERLSAPKRPRRVGPPRTPELEAEVAAMKNRGDSQRQISRTTGLSEGTVSSILNYKKR